MPRGKSPSLRHRIAVEAARIILDQGHRDFSAARRKAAQRLGCTNRRELPDNSEIEQALREYQRLFHKERQTGELERLRKLASEAMHSMREFNPRLVGPVLDGSADIHSKVQLHLFAESPEEVVFWLLNQRIPFQSSETTLRYRNGAKKSFPMYRFHAGQTELELIVFPPQGLRQAPLCPVTNQPQARASLLQLETLLDWRETRSDRE